MLLFLQVVCLTFSIYPQDVNHQMISPDSIYRQASSHLDQENYQEAIKKLNLLRYSKDWVKDPGNLRKTYNNLGFAFFYQYQFDSSIYYYKKSNEYAIALKDTMKIISSFNSIAMGYRELAKFGLSLAFSQKALDLAERWNDPLVQPNILTNIGLMYQSLGRNTEALSYHQASLAKSQEARDSSAMTNALHNIALSFKALQRFDSSLNYNLKSLELKRRLGKEPRELVPTINNLGTTQLAMGNLSEAEKYFLESNILYKQVNDTSGLLISYTNLGDLALRRNQLDRSQAYLDSGAVLFPRISDLDFKRDNLELRLATLEKKQDFKTALEVYRELTAINELIFQDEKLKVQQVESSYQINQESLLRRTAEQQRSLAQAQAKSSNQFVILLSAIIVLTLLFVGQLFRFNRKLRVKNEIIQDQKRDNEHRIYNFLSRLQGLIRMASDHVSDKTSREILLNSEAAIISAAALQEHLTYSDLENEELYVGQYLEGLTVRLREMFKLTGSMAKLDVTVGEDALLPVQTVMNLGLIVSEMVTNSMKYAFTQSIPEPKVEIIVRKVDKTLSIQVSDNGIGISEVHKKGLGSGLIQRLAKYIEAELTMSDGTGTQYSICFNLMKCP